MAGFVYVIMASSGHVKIGKANKVATRLATLKTASPFPLTLVVSIPCEEPLVVEAALHKRFASRRVHGEWFFVSQRDLEYLAGLNEDSDIFEDWFDAEDAAVNNADMMEQWHDMTAPLWGEL